MYIPNEVIDKVLMFCDSDDINRWESYEKMFETTFLKKRYSSITEASRYGNLMCVKYLVSVGADIHVDDDYSLRCSARYGHLEVVKYLVSLGADINKLEKIK